MFNYIAKASNVRNYLHTFIDNLSIVLAKSSEFYKPNLLTFYMQHEIELNVSFNLIYVTRFEKKPTFTHTTSRHTCTIKR